MKKILLQITISFTFFLSYQNIFAQPTCAGEQGQLNYYYWNNLTSSVITQLLDDENYPNTPDGRVLLSGLKTPHSFNDYYGARMRGYIRPDVTGDYVFNVSGDHDIHFFLSSDTTFANLEKICEVYHSGNPGHDTYPEQTSDTIQLIADNYYFFELLHKEVNGGDFAYIYWKTPTNPDDWRIIEGANVFDYTCDIICQPYGTACDDENPDTVNDIEDGNCNCYGQPPIDSSCIGKRGELRVWYYEDIPGFMLSDLEASPNYPNNPTSGELLDACLFNPDNGIEYGALLKAFIRIPETGDYVFRLNGNNESQFLLSSGTSHDQSDLTLTAYLEYNNPTQKDTSDIINLQDGQYYYLEILNKGNGNGDICYLHWMRPNSDEFEAIDADYFYAFNNCDDICIPDGVPCDDGDIMTYQDQYENCECVGMPCDVPDCSNGVNYIPFSACNPSDEHLNNKLDSWLSCQVSPNPNADRPDSHWVLFDLHEIHKLHATHIWNYNAENETGKGFKDVVIDYSLDGENWEEYDTYQWEEATGTNDYTGFEGPDFDGLPLRYLLISAINNWNGDSCAGFSEWKMFIETCPEIADLNILGSIETLTNTEEIYQIANANLTSNYEWTVTGGTIVNNSNNEITVLWDEPAIGEICALETIENGCIGTAFCQSVEIITSTKETPLSQNITLFPNPTSGQFSIKTTENIQVLDVSIYDSFGKLIIYQSRSDFDLENFPSGMYLVKVETNEGQIFKRITLQ